MQVKLDHPLNFIREKDLVDFVIVHRNGANLIISGSFSQNVKQKELDEIMAHNTLNKTSEVPAVKKTSKQLFKEAEKLKKEEDAAEAAAKKKSEDEEKSRLASKENGDDNSGDKPQEKL